VLANAYHLHLRPGEEIVEAAASIRGDYKKHSRAALAIAKEIFEAEKVLKSLLERAGV